jgi:hypothetical protein
MPPAATVEIPPVSRFAFVSRGLRGMLRGLIDVALPPLCPACREPVED